MEKYYDVIGQAHGVVDVRHAVLASSEEEAMRKAKEEFDKGNHGLINYTDDDSACFDYYPAGASKSSNQDQDAHS